MLIRFSVENFLSFNHVQEFSMIPATIRGRNEHIINSKLLKVLRLGTIYGANSSGKSNLIKAMNFAKKIIKNDIPLSSNKMFCKVDKENENKPSKFEFEFIKKNKCYAYGFTMILKEKRILSEWLYEINENDQKPIFERQTDIERLDFYINSNIEEDKMRLKLYEIDFKGDSSNLILSKINQNKKISISSKLIALKDVYDWFSEDLRIIYPEEPVMQFNNLYGNDNINKINKILQLFDTGISKIKIEEINRNKLLEELSNEAVEKFFDSYKEALSDLTNFINDTENQSLNNKLSKKNLESIKSKAKNLQIGVSLRTDDSFYNMSGKIGEDPKITTIRTEHLKSFWDYDFKEESDGTRRLFDLLEILLIGEIDSNPNKVYIIDELERSLHPKLTYRFIELFIKILKQKNVQLIFTTHESTIMDQKLLRRDEIWFVERNKENSSRLYSLDRFQERYDKKLNKAYLSGRYGAIPIFKDFSFEEDL